MKKDILHNLLPTPSFLKPLLISIKLLLSVFTITCSRGKEIKRLIHFLWNTKKLHHLQHFTIACTALQKTKPSSVLSPRSLPSNLGWVLLCWYPKKQVYLACSTCETRKKMATLVHAVPVYWQSMQPCDVSNRLAPTWSTYRSWRDLLC